MSRKIKAAVYVSNDAEFKELVRFLDPDKYELCQMVFGQMRTSPEDGVYDIHIVSVNANAASLMAGQDAGAAVFPHNTLAVVTDPAPAARLWAFQRGAREALVRPFTPEEFSLAINRVFTSSPDYLHEALTDAKIIEFLKDLVARKINVIEPTLSPEAPYAHRYPAVLKFFGNMGADTDFLEELSEKMLLSKKLVNRIRVCSLCDDYRFNYREVCPQCSSLNIHQEQMIHHFACGHVNSLEAFKKGAEWVCPKCNQTLRHIGLDYEKPAKNYRCHDCQNIFADPKVQAQCVRCGYICDPNQTLERHIYAYELTDYARQTIESGELSAKNILSLLQNKFSGIYNKEYFEHELRREHIRAQRYGYAFSFMLVRIGDFDHLLQNNADKIHLYVQSIFSALSSNLRTLDFTCVWDRDTLGVILPDTKGEGAKVVISRMFDTIKKMEFLYDIHKPNISASVVAYEKQFANSEEMIKQALQELKA